MDRIGQERPEADQAPKDYDNLGREGESTEERTVANQRLKVHDCEGLHAVDEHGVCGRCGEKVDISDRSPHFVDAKTGEDVTDGEGRQAFMEREFGLRDLASGRVASARMSDGITKEGFMEFVDDLVKREQRPQLPETLLGFPIRYSDFMPELASKTRPVIVFGRYCHACNRIAVGGTDVCAPPDREKAPKLFLRWRLYHAGFKGGDRKGPTTFAVGFEQLQAVKEVLAMLDSGQRRQDVVRVLEAGARNAIVGMVEQYSR